MSEEDELFNESVERLIVLVREQNQAINQSNATMKVMNEKLLAWTDRLDYIETRLDRQESDITELKVRLL